VPYGHEDDFVIDIMPLLFPDGIEKDQWGNYFYKIGESRTIFASHLDTVSKDYIAVNHVFDGNYIKTDGKTTLGADDKAGVTVMLYMIENKIPGLYYFFIGEEVGCIGSGMAAKYGDFMGKYDRIISFDRRDTSSIITYQSSYRCCSDAFADDLCRELNKYGLDYEKDTGGVYTDSAEFVSIVPECTNVSVGYYREHTTEERQDINHLISLCKASINVKWEELSVERNVNIHEKKSYSFTTESFRQLQNKQNSNWSKRRPAEEWSYGMNDDWYEEDLEYSCRNSKKSKRNRRSKNKKIYFDNGGSLLEISKIEESVIDNDYSWLLDKFIDVNGFTPMSLVPSELNIIKDIYLDMDDAYDKFIYNSISADIYGGLNKHNTF
jgi:hypothetical protein